MSTSKHEHTIGLWRVDYDANISWLFESATYYEIEESEAIFKFCPYCGEKLHIMKKDPNSL